MESYREVCDKLLLQDKIDSKAILFYEGVGKKEYPLKINVKTKKMLQEHVKTLALKSGVEGYVIILNAYTTIIDRKTGKKETKDSIVCTLYTPHTKIQQIICDKVVIETLDGREMTLDNWDAWNTGSLEILKTGRKK
jgi:hypothetical protein